ncbi:MAG: helix-turn-helix transcriptional regulator [Rhodobacteraceae bacterium]|nr:helix-turn-helix transcriptional regulator [Paracoccaceae bacterium]
MFGQNLRMLTALYPSVSEVSRQLGINRTQFNRYLAGESFPRPDVLARICAFFDVDARILLSPADQIPKAGGVLNSAYLQDHIGKNLGAIPPEIFPRGIYRFLRQSFTHPARFLVALALIFERDGLTMVRGFESKEAVRNNGQSVNAADREYRGFVMQQDDGVAFLASRRSGNTSSFSFLTRVPSLSTRLWIGYVARTLRESDASPRAVRMIFEHLGPDRSEILRTARGPSIMTEDALSPAYRELLRVSQPFQ